MYEVIDNTCIEHFIPCEPDENSSFDSIEKCFFEAASMRKVGDTYYMIYSPKQGSRLAYATSKSPIGPFEYRGYIVDNGDCYPGGNNHGSIANINGQWYIFYHRMTNGTIMSRRGCVEKIEILPDGTIPTVEMTSLGFENALSPYKKTFADIACVIKGQAFITERNIFERPITNIKNGDVIGYKYFDFGDDFGSRTMMFYAKINSFGCSANMHILIDDENGEEIGTAKIGENSGIISTVTKAVTGRHALYFKIDTDYSGWTADFFKDRCLFELIEFVFEK